MTHSHRELIQSREDGTEIGTCQVCGQVREYGRLEYDAQGSLRNREVKIIKEGTMEYTGEFERELIESEIIAAYQEGEMPVQTILGSWGISSDELYKILRKHNIEPNRNPHCGQKKGEPDPASGCGIDDILEPEHILESFPINPVLGVVSTLLPQPGTELSSQQREALLKIVSGCIDFVYPVKEG